MMREPPVAAPAGTPPLVIIVVLNWNKWRLNQ
jgi:hypothetical protein